jgi:protein-S-isoprenylcysteine O-methyltransferase Ste14
MSGDDKRRSRLALADFSERACVAVGLIWFFLANLGSHQPTDWLVVIADAVTVFFIFFRRPTTLVSYRPTDWALALAGTLGGMLARPGGASLIPHTVAAVLVLEGFVIQLAAKLSLNRSFGIAPANRGIKTTWAYRMVRHPMYFGYMLIQTAYVLGNASLFNIVVLSITWACQFGRIFREEQFLLNDPAYRDYARRVRFRMVPLVF